MKEAYLDAGVVLSKNLRKRDITRQKSAVINYIIRNPHATVSQIQKKTRVNIPRTFGSIKNAFCAAGIGYTTKKPASGIQNIEVIKRSKLYEKKITKLLMGFGEVRSQIKTTAGIADCILQSSVGEFVVEIKDFRARNNITLSQIKQLIRYMQALKIDQGLPICPEESLPKRKNQRNLFIGDLRVNIISEEYLRGCSIKELSPYILAE